MTSDDRKVHDSANPELTGVSQERRFSFLNRVSRRLYSDKAALVAVVFLTLVLAAALFASYLAPYDYLRQDLRARLQPPLTPGHLLGTDPLGRDVLSQLIYSARLSLLIAFGSVGLAIAIGLPLGLIAGYFRGKADTIIMRIADAQFAFSSLLMIMVLVVLIGPGARTLVIVFGIATWILHARVVRAEALSLRDVEFVRAVRTMGGSNGRIVRRHILPHVSPTMTSLGILEAARFLVGEATLSFLGFGVQPPNISWGLMIAQGRDYLVSGWWVVTSAGLCVTFTVLAINIVGNWLRKSG